MAGEKLTDEQRKDPKQHEFVPYQPGSKKCKWCPFNRKAHLNYKEK